MVDFKSRQLLSSSNYQNNSVLSSFKFSFSARIQLHMRGHLEDDLKAPQIAYLHRL